MRRLIRLVGYMAAAAVSLLLFRLVSPGVAFGLSVAIFITTFVLMRLALRRSDL